MINTKPLLLCVLLLLCLTVPTAHAAPFTSSHGYTVTPPSGWHLNATGSSGNDVVIYTNSDGTPEIPTPNFGVRIGPQGKIKTLDIAKQGMVGSYRKGYPSLVLVSQAYSSVTGKPDLDTTFLIGRPGHLTRIRQVLVLQSASVYFFTAACPDRIHDKYDAIFAQILASVHWKS